MEPHYTPQQVAERWGLSTKVVRKLFRNEPGVIKIGVEESRFKRGKIFLRLPESVVRRVHEKLCA